MGEYVVGRLTRYFSWISLPEFHLTDAIEILILAAAIYYIMKWIKNTKAWMLLRGIIFILLFVILSWILRLDTILFLSKKLLSIIAIGVVVIFQPEIRRALEKLGEQSFLSRLFTAGASSTDDQVMSDKTIRGIVKACYNMGKVCTGALIVVERKIVLSEYEHTGIEIDGLVSEQLLENVFEHNTPLHDGAVIIRGNRVVSATCYLPLSDNQQLPKNLGTRHRAAVGLSEVSDALIIIVSEERGTVSYAMDRALHTDVTSEELVQKLKDVRNLPADRKPKRGWKGRE